MDPAPPSIPPLGVVQNCYVVRDLDAACARFHALYGIGPFIGGSEVELADHRYRGRPSGPIRLRGVFVQSGPLNVELVEILSDGPCAFTDMFARGDEGFHHTAIFSDDYAATRDAWVAAGHPVASEFSFGDDDICYIDARRDHGHMIELYPESPIIRAMYRQAAEAAAGWDGTGLIRPWAPSV